MTDFEKLKDMYDRAGIKYESKKFSIEFEEYQTGIFTAHEFDSSGKLISVWSIE